MWLFISSSSGATLEQENLETQLKERKQRTTKELFTSIIFQPAAQGASKYKF